MGYFKPETELTFNSVVALWSQFYKTLIEDPRDCFEFDLSEVVYCDSAGLALLLEANKLCKKYNKTFKIIAISAATRSLAEFYGVNEILEVI